MSEKKCNLAEAFHKDNLFYFVLGSLISSDSVFSKEDVEKSMKTLSEIEEDLKVSSLDEKVKSKYMEKINQCKEVLNADLKRFEKRE